MNDLESQALRLIGDQGLESYADIQAIRDSVNDAIQEIQMATGGYTGTFHVPLISNTTWYRFSPHAYDFGFPIGVWYDDQQRRVTQTDLTVLSRTNPHWMQDTGPPWQYVPIGLDIIGVWPKPSASSGVLTITAAVIPKPYTTDTNVLPLRDDLRWGVVQYAAAEYFASVGDGGRAATFYREYARSLGHIVNIPRSIWQMAQPRVSQ